MAKFVNVSPRGALEIPALGGRIVQPGEVFEVPAKLAASIASPGRFEPVKRGQQDRAPEDQSGDEHEQNEPDGQAPDSDQASAGEEDQ